MKKIFLMTFVSIFAVSAAFAQVKNVKKAYKLSEAYENPDFDQAEILIEKVMPDVIGEIDRTAAVRRW